MPKLSVVPPTEPPAAEKLRQRIKRMPKPASVIQCVCGSRSFTTVVHGPELVAGKIRGGSKGLACLHCKAIAL